MYLLPLIATATEATGKLPAALIAKQPNLNSTISVDALVAQEIRFMATLQDNEPTSPSKRKYSQLFDRLDAATDTPNEVEEVSPQWTEVNELHIALPSDYLPSIVGHTNLASAVATEKALRSVTAHEQLDALRGELITTFGHRLTSRYIKGQTLKTRAHSAVHRKYAAVKNLADEYDRTRMRLVKLGAQPEEMESLLPLTVTDLRPFNMESAEQELGVEEWRRRPTQRGSKKISPSWLWQRWTIVNSAESPRLKDVFIEGERTLIMLFVLL